MLIDNTSVQAYIRSVENYSLDDPFLFFQFLLRCDKRKCENINFDFFACPSNKYNISIFPKSSPQKLSNITDERLRTANEIASAYIDMYDGLPMIYLTIDYILSKNADQKSRKQYCLDCKQPDGKYELKFLQSSIKNICRKNSFFPIFGVMHFGEKPRGKIYTAMPPHGHFLLLAKAEALNDEIYHQAYQSLIAAVHAKWQRTVIETNCEKEI